MRIYVSGILPEGCDLPIYVKVALTEYIEKGCGIVISARTDSELRERLRIFCNSFPNPRTDLICKTVDFPGLEECITIDEFEKYEIGHAFFLWDRKDPLTLMEILRMKCMKPEVYLYDTDEVTMTSVSLIRFIVPSRREGTVPFDQKCSVPEKIFEQLKCPERTKKYIAEHTFCKSEMVSLVKFSDNDFADKMLMFKQLEETEDVLNDLVEYHYRKFRESDYEPEELLSESLYVLLLPNNPDLSDPPYSFCRYAKFKTVEALSGLYESGSILSLSDGKPGFMAVIDGKFNLVLMPFRNKDKIKFSIQRTTEYELFRSRLSDKTSLELYNLLKLVDPGFNGKFLSQKAISRIIEIYSVTGNWITLEKFKETMELIDRFDQSMESPWEE